MIIRDSPFDAATTRGRIVREVTAAGNTVFADLDQAEFARAAGLELRPTYVVIFGNPRAGSAIMHASARAGYELPLKLLIWREGERTYVAYRPPSEMSATYGLAELQSLLDAMDSALGSIVERATAPEHER